MSICCAYCVHGCPPPSTFSTDLNLTWTGVYLGSRPPLLHLFTNTQHSASQRLIPAWTGDFVHHNLTTQEGPAKFCTACYNNYQFLYQSAQAGASLKCECWAHQEGSLVMKVEASMAEYMVTSSHELKLDAL
ncbi:hypothetical protein Bbelb_224300 [Branchiostoma belcheri]|nr:hypothetical protein Bbelb_224300 [Branchiostoma belcheri]